jgi:hypothetical protein
VPEGSSDSGTIEVALEPGPILYRSKRPFAFDSTFLIVSVLIKANGRFYRYKIVYSDGPSIPPELIVEPGLVIPLGPVARLETQTAANGCKRLATPGKNLFFVRHRSVTRPETMI